MYVEPSGQSGLGGSGLFGLATSPPIGQSLAARTLDRASGALGIVNSELDAVRVAEIELSEVAVKVSLAAMLIDARHTALENAEEAFDGLRVSVAANPFFFAVIYSFMAGEAAGDRAVHVGLIDAEMAGGGGVLQDDAADLASGDVLNPHRASLTAALDQGHDRDLVAICHALLAPAAFIIEVPRVFGTFFAAIEGFVALDGLTIAAEWPGSAFVHCLANAVHQEPRALVGDPERAMDLMS
jgi:hypothetical protein